MVDPDTIFDTQIKRIHEYKRQLLNALHIDRALQSPARESELDVPPRTFFFAGKAAPAYHFAKLVIKFINNLAGDHRRRPGGERPAQSGVRAGLPCLSRRAAHSGQ